jgi:FMN phosphatase YigB (HAD superfamily)
LFIDNREWNLKPARKLGMKTILFKNNKQTIKDLKKLKLLK